MAKELTKQKCVPCEGGIEPMKLSEAKSYMEFVPGWTLGKTDKGYNQIVREFKFKGFKPALAFANTVGRIAEREGHHPNIYIYSWNRLRLELYTHAIRGLHMNDFIVAAKINQKLPKSE